MKDIRDFIKDERSLNRYLLSKVGKLWNDVYSDICSIASLRSRDGWMLRERIQWNVALDCYIGEDGQVYERSRFMGHLPVKGLYIHPVSGLLLNEVEKTYHGNWMQPRTWEQELNYLSVENGNWYVKEKGSWFFHWIEHYNEKVFKTEWNAERKEDERTGEFYFRDRTSLHKRQLNKREVKAILPAVQVNGTNKDMMARLNGEYIPVWKWRT